MKLKQNYGLIAFSIVAFFFFFLTIEMTTEYLTKDKIPERQKMKTNKKARTARVQEEDDAFNQHT